MDWNLIVTQTVQQAFGPLAVAFCLAAIGLNVHFGYTGLLNFGQAGFMAIAAYGLASLVATWGFNFWLGAIWGLILVVVLAFILGLPTLRLRADYLAIVTIAAAEMIRQTVGSVTLKDYFGGQEGIQQFIDTFRSLNPYGARVSILGVSWSGNDFWALTVGWTLVAIASLLVFLLVRSPWGRVLKAIREDEDAVRSLGKNVYAYKMQALIIGGLFGGLGGYIYGFYYATITPSAFATDTTFFAFTMLLLGGAGRVFGPILGSVLLWGMITFLDQFFRQASDAGYIPSAIMDANQASLMRFVVLGLALMLLMIFRPQGILGDRRELAIDAR